MASEIRVNQIQSRTGVSTISFTETGPIISGVTTITGDLDVTGLVSYDDVTNIDSVGVVTARNSLHVTGGSVGIGTDSPVSGVKLHLQDTSACRIQLSTDNTGHTSSDGARLMIDSSNNFEILNRENANIEFFTNNTERLSITSAGTLESYSPDDTTPNIKWRSNDTNWYGSLNQSVHGATITTFLSCGGDWDANGTTYSATKALAAYPTSAIAVHNQYNNSWGSQFVFLTKAGGSSTTDGAVTERLRIDSAGRLMIGQTSAYSATGTGTMMLTVTNSTTSRTDAAISNQDSGDNASAAIVLATHGQDYILEATGSGNTTDGTRAFRILKDTNERFRIDTSGNKYTNVGAIGHGSSGYTNFANAGRTTYNNVSIRAGQHNAGTTPTNSNSVIKIYPAGVRSSTTGNLTGGIAWQHLDPDNGTWDTQYGAGAQIWMGAALHDTPGQERDRFNLWMNSQTSGNSQPHNLAIEAYPNGMVRHPKVPAFHVSGGTTLTASTNNVIISPNVDFNNGNHYSTSNGRFTAPIDGYYQFSFWGLLYSHPSGVINIFYSKNGSQYADLVQGGADSNSHTSRSGTVMMSMSAGDYAELRINPGSSGAHAYSSQWNMCGFLVG